ncbi:MAG: hypothetical protein ACXVQY_08400, partial [Actinomycetota bacterium]
DPEGRARVAVLQNVGLKLIDYALEVNDGSAGSKPSCPEIVPLLARDLLTSASSFQKSPTACHATENHQPDREGVRV